MSDFSQPILRSETWMGVGKSPRCHRRRRWFLLNAIPFSVWRVAGVMSEQICRTLERDSGKGVQIPLTVPYKRRTANRVKTVVLARIV